MNTKQIAIAVGSGVAAAGLAYLIYKKLFWDTIAVESESTELFLSVDGSNLNQSVDEYIILVKTIMKNYPQCLRNLRDQFRHRRRQLLHNVVEYTKYINNFLAAYPSNDQMVQLNIDETLEQFQISRERFSELMSQYDSDPRVKQILGRQHFENNLSGSIDTPENLTEDCLKVILQEKLNLLRKQPWAKCKEDFLRSEILLADDTWIRYGYEEEQLVAANQKYKTATIQRLKEQIVNATLAITPSELPPPFTFA